MPLYKMKNNNSSPFNNFIDLTAEATNAKLRLPVFMSKQLWSQITGEAHPKPDDPRILSVLSQLKQAIRECSDGQGYFGGLERGVDFDVEIGARSTTAFASVDFEVDCAVLCLKTADEAFAQLPERHALISSELEWQDPIIQAEKIAITIGREELIGPSNLIRLNERNDFAEKNIVHGTSAGGAYVRFADRSPRATWRYAVPGTEHHFLIYGVAYDLAKAKEDSITLSQDAVKNLEQHRKSRQHLQGDGVDVHSSKISLEDLRALLACGDNDEHYEFWTVAESIDWLELRGTRLCRIGAVLMLPKDIPFRATIFAHPDVLGRCIPEQGDNIQGAMLLLGYHVK